MSREKTFGTLAAVQMAEKTGTFKQVECLW
jgi:hypothetical protein